MGFSWKETNPAEKSYQEDIHCISLQKLYHWLNQPVTGTHSHFDLRTVIHKTKRFAHLHQHYKNVKKKEKLKLIFTLVSPAIGATLQTFLDLSVFMMELFPTLG